MLQKKAEKCRTWGTYILDDTRSLNAEELNRELRAMRAAGERIDLRIYQSAQSKYEHGAYAVKAAMDAGVKHVLLFSEPPAASTAGDSTPKRHE